MTVINADMMWSMVVETLPLTIFWKDRQSRYLGCNQRLAAAVGLERPADIVGMTDYDLFEPAMAEGFRADDADVMERGVPKLGIVELLSINNGPYFWLETHKMPLFDAENNVVGLLGFAHNLDARLEAYRAKNETKQALAASKQKSIFLANMSHEIRTPLNAIVGMASMFQIDNLNDEQKQQIQIIGDAGSSLMRVVDDILDLSKVEAGKIEINETPFDLDDLVSGAIAPFRKAAGDRGLKLTQTVQDAARGRFVGDVSRLRQILSNLVSNAIKFTQEGSVDIQVRTGEAQTNGQKQLVFAVTDTGKGLSQDAINRLFRPFSQADKTISQTHGGTGLGLAICKQYCQLMRGDIWVNSTLDKGSTFEFSVMVRTDAEPSRPPSSPANDTGRTALAELGLRVLVAEDNPVNRLVVSTMLKQLNASVAFAENGREALDTWQSCDIDVILMDVRMPVMNGLEATSKIRNIERENGLARTPILGFTADVLHDHVRAYKDHGVDGVLGKPTTLDALVASLAELVLGQKAENGAPQNGAPHKGVPHKGISGAP